MRPLPSDGSILTAQGVVRHADDVGGFASASITDASGGLVAVCTQHGRWLKGAHAAGDDVPPSTDRPPSAPPGDRRGRRPSTWPTRAGGSRRHAEPAGALQRDDGHDVR
jgi:hypothetical protein